MSKNIVFPKKGNLEQVLHIIGYLKRHNKTSLMFDYSNTTMNGSFLIITIGSTSIRATRRIILLKYLN